MSSRLLGVVLCGGKSSRMGQDKSLLPHPSGGTFLSHAFDRLTGIVDQVVVSGGLPGAVSAKVLPDSKPYQGPVVGIATALSFAARSGFDACLITPVDMPWLTTEDLTGLREVWERELKLCCAVSANDGRLQPLVAIYPTSLQAMLNDVADSQDRSLSRWIQTQHPLMVSISPQSGRNINTREDLCDGFR